jgi:hypothetical protein
MAKSDFYTRFGIKLDMKEVRRKFVARAYNRILDPLPGKTTDQYLWRLIEKMGDDFGVRMEMTYGTWPVFAARHVGDDFYRVLRTLELVGVTCYDAAGWLFAEIVQLLEDSEEPLGIVYDVPTFRPQGDKLLDDRLVAEPLARLRGFPSVTGPLEKALGHLLASEKDSARLADSVTDAYEALEAMAKVQTGRQERDLSANAEAFLSKIDASPQYKEMLKKYIEYANRFRHAPSETKPRPQIKYKEAESFIYMTGLLLRLATS